MKLVKTLPFTTVILFASACSTDGGPVVISDTDHKVIVGGGMADTKDLSEQVTARLKNNGQTALAGIQVSNPNPDTIRLSGVVDNSATLHEAERVAYQVEGVRFVVNSLEIRR